MRLRPFLLALALLAPAAARADLLYVLNSGEASISVLDATTREQVRRIPVLREAHHLVLTPDATELVVGDSGGNELIFLEPLTGEVRRRLRISNPYHLEYSPDGRFLVIASLRREIYALSRIRHPGIVRLVDHGTVDGLPWCALEFVEGETLQAILEQVDMRPTHAVHDTPTTATMDQIRAALAVIKEAQDAGQFRKVSGNSYTDDLITGEVWLAIGWSGDIASLKAVDRPEIEYVLPEKGAMSFVDNCLIPLGAKNKAGAEVFLNHVYDPAVSGPLFEAITYVSPVEGATAFMTAAGQTNPFVNPPPGARLYEFRDVTEAEEEEIVTLFAEATQL